MFESHPWSPTLDINGKKTKKRESHVQCDKSERVDECLDSQTVAENFTWCVLRVAGTHNCGDEEIFVSPHRVLDQKA